MKNVGIAQHSGSSSAGDRRPGRVGLADALIARLEAVAEAVMGGPHDNGSGPKKRPAGRL